jgi:hypothetical protein
MRLPQCDSNSRRGIVLLVVITLLTLFAVVGITFVIYSQAEAGSARSWRESESLQRPDMDPESLLAYFLNQLIYDTTNPNSALQGHSLARTMYGLPGSTVPYNGTGRIHTNANAAQDDYYQVDYTNYSGAANPRSPSQYGSPNASYTYPDFNTMCLAAVRASDGAVLIPSYFRTNPTQGQSPITLRPSTTYHTQFPAQEDAGGDVKNLADSPGYLTNAANSTFANNDSVWIDIGFPVMKAGDGRKFKPLFAPLIQDLDNRCNVNVHGNVLGMIGGGYYTVSHQGWSPGEVNLGKIVTQNNEAGNLFVSPMQNTVAGRYDPTQWNNFWSGTGQYGRSNQTLKGIYSPGGHFYCSTNLDCWSPWDTGALQLPGNSGFGFPYLSGTYSHGWWWSSIDSDYNPALFNLYDPKQNCYWIGASPPESGNQRTFPPSNLEALLRYSDRGSPALTSDLFRLCPQSFGTAKTRRLVTTHSFDLSAPGVMPCIANQGSPSPYQMAAGATYPSQAPIAFPAVGASPNAGEFGPNWNAMASAQQNQALYKRIDLNRGFVDYPQLDGNTYQFTNQAGYQTGLQNRQQLTQEIFNVFVAVTGAGNVATAQPNTPEYDALRWLAQLSVNIVDFVDYPTGIATQVQPAPDDVITSFNWNPAQQASIPNGWVFGTVLPRLVLNEAYIEMVNTASDVANNAQTISNYDVNCWVELHNPFAPGGGGACCGNQAVPTPLNGVARLQSPPAATNPYAWYRVIVAQTGQGTGTDNTTIMTQNSNVLGTPQNVKTVVDQYTADPTCQGVALNGDNLNQVLTNYNGTMQAGQQGQNQGFYVLGPKTPFPGTQGNAAFFATLPVKEQQCLDQNYQNINSSMHYVYSSQAQPPVDQNGNIQNLTHTIALQRLACPYMPPQPVPTQANFNPYVTVDYLLSVPTNNGVTLGATGQAANPAATPVANRYSLGRNQPYAADQTQQVKQSQANPPAGQPLNSFFMINAQTANQAGQQWAYDWLMHANRPIISPIDLLQVSGFKPHQLTQMFMTQGTDPNTGKPLAQGKFQHRAPWFQSTPQSSYTQAPQSGTMLYRALEFFEGGIRPQWSPPGARTPGKININTIWDSDTWQALCDQWPINFFQAQGVNNVYTAMINSRTPNGVPGPNDNPFVGLAAPFAPQGLQYPQAWGFGINNTLLRPDPNAANLTMDPLKRLLQVNPDPNQGELAGSAADHPYLRMELLNKIFGSTTVRSNVFAVWLTVGFFEVLDDSNPSKPPVLGQEIGRAENRHIRHRMFAMLDRTNLSISPTNPNQAGPRPWFINGLSAVTQTGQATTVTVPTVSGAYEEGSWSLQQGMQLVVDAGPSQETVTVTAVDAVNLTFTATFNKPHPIGFAVGNAILGNPGPQAVFDMRNPSYGGVVRYFSLIQ